VHGTVPHLEPMEISLLLEIFQVRKCSESSPFGAEELYVNFLLSALVATISSCKPDEEQRIRALAEIFNRVFRTFHEHYYPLIDQFLFSTMVGFLWTPLAVSADHFFFFFRMKNGKKSRGKVWCLA
jgi:hypothetical protein